MSLTTLISGNASGKAGPSSSSQSPPSPASSGGNPTDPSLAGPELSSSAATTTPGDPSSSTTSPSLWQSITNPGANPLLSAGFSLMILGAALGISRKALIQGAALAQKRMLVTLEIPSKDKAHGWLLGWMEEQTRRSQGQPPLSAFANAKDILGLRSSAQKAGESSSDVSALPPPVRIHSRDLAVQSSLPRPNQGSNAQSQAMMLSGQPMSPSDAAAAASRRKASFSLVPGPGTHWFRYHGAWIRLQRERNAKLIDISTGAPWETLTLTTLYSDRSIFPRLLSEAQSLASQNIQGKTIIYTAWGVEWRSFGQPRKVRQLESVVLAQGQRQRIVDDITSFLGREEWYARRGIPYRRGYLLHGAPGSGKTSIIQALAGSLDMSICLLNLSERGLTDDKLNHLLSLAPERSIILLEDIDAAFPSRTATSTPEQKLEYQTSVTFSGLLNALDGVASGESRIVMMTTNHVERLDPALIRPGRVDLIEELGDADEGMVRELFDRFYGQSKSEDKTQASHHHDEKQLPEPLPSLPSAETLQHIRADLVRLVAEVSVLRRRELGLGSEGRYVNANAPEASPAAAEPPAGRTKATPLPAKRGGVSMAELQGLFIRYPQNPIGAVTELEEEKRASVEAH